MHKPLDYGLHFLDEWNYDDDGDCGPCHWPVKSMGNAQSPIDFKLSIIKPIKLHDTLKFVRYDKPINGHIVNNGHSSMKI